MYGLSTARLHTYGHSPKSANIVSEHVVVHDKSRTDIGHLAPHVGVSRLRISSNGGSVILVYSKPYRARPFTTAHIHQVFRHTPEQPHAAKITFQIHLAEIKRIVVACLHTAISSLAAILTYNKVSVAMVGHLLFYRLV